ncbi:ribonuclease P protein subunit p29 [Eucyclogobius newberryi]|uniref:ribonuclease P protein subunit p29 n=1 Tax=Eucyclogobius newberryi TaxID=166745 RepID=UPI003B593DB1
MNEAAVNDPIPQELTGALGLQPAAKSKADAFARSFLRRSLRDGSRSDVKEILTHKALILGYTRPKKDKPKKNKKAKGLNAKQKRDLKIFHIKAEHQKYELFLPLHELWKQYITDLCNGLQPTTNPQLVQGKLLKADFHGAVIKVVRSKCASYVGLTGILIQEFKHVFKIITKKDELKVIPKRHSMFEIEVNGFVSHIYGSRIEQRASERSAKKFKSKGAIDL